MDISIRKKPAGVNRQAQVAEQRAVESGSISERADTDQFLEADSQSHNRPSGEDFKKSLKSLKFGAQETAPRPSRTVARHQRNLDSLGFMKEQFLALDGSDRDLDDRPGGVQLGGTQQDLKDGLLTGTLTPDGQFAVAFSESSLRWPKHLIADFSQESPEVIDLTIWHGKIKGAKKSLAPNGDMTKAQVQVDSLWPLVEGRNLFYPSASEINHINALDFGEPEIFEPGVDEWDDDIIANHNKQVQSLYEQREYFLSQDGTDADLDQRKGGVRLAVPEKGKQTGDQVSGTLTPGGEFLIARKTSEDGRTKTRYLATTFGEEPLEVLDYSEAPRQAYTTVEKSSLDENGVLSSSRADPGSWMLATKEHFFPTEPKTESEILFRS